MTNLTGISNQNRGGTQCGRHPQGRRARGTTPAFFSEKTEGSEQSPFHSPRVPLTTTVLVFPRIMNFIRIWSRAVSGGSVGHHARRQSCSVGTAPALPPDGVEVSKSSTCWPLPAASLSPKNLTSADTTFVHTALQAFDGTAPIELASQPPSSWYISDSFARAELGACFPNTWQFACRSAQVSAPGDYVSTFTGSGEPVLIVRDEAGTLRAFSNVCAHHAARVADGCGSGADKFVCPYHAWTYNLQGRLVKATRLKGIQDFRAGKVSLPVLDVEAWGPFVFVRKSSSADVDVTHPWRTTVASQLEPLVAELDRVSDPLPRWSSGGWKHFHFLKRRVYDIPCNWKVYVDNYLDGGYHIPHLHLGLDAELDMASYTTTLHSTISVQKCKAHPRGAARVGTDAVYAFMFPNFAVNRLVPSPYAFSLCRVTELLLCRLY